MWMGNTPTGLEKCDVNSLAMSSIVKDQKRNFTGSWVPLLALMILCGIVNQTQAALLAWDPTPGATGYKLYSGTSSRTYTTVADVGNLTSNSVVLAIGSTYFFAVTAYNGSGESDFSTEVSYTPVPSLLPPTVSPIANQTVNKNQTLAVSFTVGDLDTPLGSLSVQASASNGTLLPTSAIVLGGSGANRTLTLSPALNQNGTANVTVSVSDGTTSVTSSFVLTVTRSNNPPAIVAPAAISANKETATPIAGVSFSDPDGGTASYTVTFTAGAGVVQLATNIAGGITASQVTSNGSGSVRISAGLAVINTTLSNPNGLAFTGKLNFVGLDTVGILVNDNGNSGLGGALSATRTISATVVGNTLDNWRTQEFSFADLIDPTKEATVWGDKADPDGDGRDNLLEFAVGLDPNTSEANQQAVVVSIVDVGGIKYSALTFSRRINESLLQYVPEVSADKQTWNFGPAFVQEVRTTPLNSTFQQVYCQDLTPVLPQAPRFIRLRVIKP